MQPVAWAMMASLPMALQTQAHGQGLAAALAGPVTRSEELFPGHHPGGVGIELLAFCKPEFFHQPLTPYQVKFLAGSLLDFV